MEQDAFGKLIQLVSEDASVLDIGAGGLHGENTTDALIKRFPNYTGICTEKSKDEIEVFQAQRAENGEKPANIILDDFYQHPFEQEFDFIVSDLSIEGNLEGWSENWERTIQCLKPGGYFSTYIMTTTQYGDPLYTPLLIKKHMLEYWGAKDETELRDKIDKKLNTIDTLEFVLALQEKRRPYITWVLLKKK